MDRFVGRKNELSILEEFYDGSKFKACSVIGRRRIGKTSLIEEFAKDKETWSIQFLNSNLDANLKLLGYTMSRYRGKKIEYESTFDFFTDLFEYIRGRKILIVFDEFPYMVECDESFSGLTQYLIDKELGESKLILSGSLVKTMVFETENYSRPLYGRTRKLELRPMTLEECSQFHPELSDMDQLKLYLLTGGVPLYCDVPEVKTFDEYVRRYVLEPNSYFAQEGERIIERELSPKEKYISILDSMRGRRNDTNTISSRSGIDRDSCMKFIKRMESLGLVDATKPMFGAPRKPIYYSISDRMLAFHFLVMRNDTSYYPDADSRYESLRPLIDTERGHLFESYCRDLITRSYHVKEIGTWWGAGPKTDRHGNTVTANGKPVTTEHEIDIAAVIVSGYNNIELAAECKFSNQPVGFEALNELDSAVRCLKSDKDVRRMIISPSGFEKGLEDFAAENGILLIGLDMILGKKSLPSL